MTFIEQWQEDLPNSLASFAELTNEVKDIDFMTGILAAGVLWPIRATVKKYDGEGNSTLSAEAADTLHQLVYVGAEEIVQVVNQFPDDRIAAARLLAEAAQENQSLQAGLNQLIQHFDAIQLFAGELAQEVLKRAPSLPTGETFNISEEIKAALVNLGGITNINELIINLSLPERSSRLKKRRVFKSLGYLMLLIISLVGYASAQDFRPTAIAEVVPTETPQPIASETSSPPSITSTPPLASDTPTPSNTPTKSPIPSSTPTKSPIPSSTPTIVPPQKVEAIPTTVTPIQTATATQTPSSTPTIVPPQKVEAIPTTVTPIQTATATQTPSSTPTATGRRPEPPDTPTPTLTAEVTYTPTETPILASSTPITPTETPILASPTPITPTETPILASPIPITPTEAAIPPTLTIMPSTSTAPTEMLESPIEEAEIETSETETP